MNKKVIFTAVVAVGFSGALALSRKPTAPAAQPPETVRRHITHHPDLFDNPLVLTDPTLDVKCICICGLHVGDTLDETISKAFDLDYASDPSDPSLAVAFSYPSPSDDTLASFYVRVADHRIFKIDLESHKLNSDLHLVSKADVPLHFGDPDITEGPAKLDDYTSTQFIYKRGVVVEVKEKTSGDDISFSISN